MLRPKMSFPLRAETERVTKKSLKGFFLPFFSGLVGEKREDKETSHQKTRPPSGQQRPRRVDEGKPSAGLPSSLRADGGGEREIFLPRPGEGALPPYERRGGGGAGGGADWEGKKHQVPPAVERCHRVTSVLPPHSTSPRCSPFRLPASGSSQSILLLLLLCVLSLLLFFVFFRLLLQPP